MKRSRIVMKNADHKAVTIPAVLVPFVNKDKVWHEKWRPNQDLLSFPHPFRAILTGPPGSGKSTTVLNILIRADPPFDRIIIVYPGGQQGTSEYDALGQSVEYLMEIPPPEFFPTPSKDMKNALKTFVIIDDFELKEIGKKQRANLDRLIGHVSTHRHVSVALCAQEYFNVPTIARRCGNVHVFWKPKDLNNLTMMSQRAGEDLESLFQLCPGARDSIWIDQTVDSPAPIRKNGFIIVTKQF